MMLSSIHGSRGRVGRATRVPAVLAALIATLLVAHATAHAEADEISCSFLEIKASNDKSGIDAKLKPLARKLERPPLSSWNSFKLMARHDIKLALMKAQDVSLKLGGKLSVLYRQHSKPQGKQDRLSLELAMDSKSGKRTLDTKIVVDAGDYFVIAHSPKKDTGDLLALTCTIP